MKRLVATALVALMLASCQEAPKGYVKGKSISSPSGIRCFLMSIRQN